MHTHAANADYGGLDYGGLFVVGSNPSAGASFPKHDIARPAPVVGAPG